MQTGRHTSSETTRKLDGQASRQRDRKLCTKVGLQKGQEARKRDISRQKGRNVYKYRWQGRLQQVDGQAKM